MVVSPAWGKWPDEPAEAYSAFVFFRELPPEQRSLAAAAVSAERIAQGSEPPEEFQDWSHRFRWQERADLWDAERQEKRRGLHEMSHRHARIAVAIQQRILERLKAILAGDFKGSEIIRWLDVAIRVERSSRSTDHEGNQESIREFIRATLSDPIACELAGRLVEQVSSRLAVASGAGVVREPLAMETGSAPDAAQPTTA